VFRLSVAIGTRLGSYEVTALLGKGGMGEVYRARDTKLNRDVAIKVLPDAVAGDPERLARFDREAQVVASLNHANIAGIYELADAGYSRCLVLEYVDGETLAERISRGPIPVLETLEIVKQIAEALEAAHEKGITHRDLKPANIKISSSGKVKVLDFGLAKILDTAATDINSTNSPTISVVHTAGGVILGTAGYMSPEQARGKAIDKRTDIWAFGCVLFEMLTGRQTFEGETISDSVARILEREPDWQLLPGNTPVRVRELLRRCLQKDARRRAHEIADVRIEIEELISNPSLRAANADTSVISRSLFRRQVLALSLVIGVVLAGVFSLILLIRYRTTNRSEPQLSGHASILLGSERFGYTSGYAHSALAISPDGQRVVYAARPGEIPQLFLRPINQFAARPIDGTENGLEPFFSPDGQWLAFFANGKLMKVPVTGGSPIPLCDVPDPQGGSWGPDNTIVFTPQWHSGLMTVSADGGTPQEFTKVDGDKRRLTHLHPQFLPGSKAVLFTVQLGDIASFDDAEIDVQMIGESQSHTLIRGGTFGRYVPTGHLIYARNGTLLAAPFDLKRLQVSGPPVMVLEDVLTTLNSGVAHVAISENGTLVYTPGGTFKPDRFPALVDRTGASRPMTGERGLFVEATVSPDGGAAAFSIVAANDDLWILNRGEATLNRFTSGDGDERYPVWTADGKRIVYQWRDHLFWKDAAGLSEPELLLSSENHQSPSSVSPDGKFLAFWETNPSTLRDIWLLPLQGDRKPQRFVTSPFDEWAPKFSPDGRWIAYTSNESRRPEIYVQSVVAGDGKHRISNEGGMWPVWSPNGRELFFLNGTNLMAAKMDPASGTSSQVTRLFTISNLLLSPTSPTYDVTPDGKGFLMVLQNEKSPPVQLNLIFNWFDELRSRVRSVN
jgi:eukaryotic-like serine/threonine-protein kinase